MPFTEDYRSPKRRGLFLVDFAGCAALTTSLSSGWEVVAESSPEHPVVAASCVSLEVGPHLSPLSSLDVESIPLWSCLLFLPSLLPSQRAPCSFSISCWVRPLAPGPVAGTQHGPLEVPPLPLPGLIWTRWTVLPTARTLREATGQVDSWKGQGDHSHSL